MTNHSGKGENTRLAALIATYEQEGLAVFLNPESFIELIDHYIVNEQFNTALSIAQYASSHYRYSTDFYARQAQVYIRLNEYDQALNVLEQALSFSPNDFELSLLRAEVFIYLDRIQEGLASLAPFKLVAQQQDLCEIFIVEALAYETSGDFEHMFYALKAALHANPKNKTALSKAGLSMDACRKYEEGSELFQWVIDQNPYASLAWHSLGQAQAYLGHNEEAIEAYEYAFLTDPTFEDAYYDCAELCMEMQHFERALDIYKDIGQRFDVDSGLLLGMGSCYHRLSLHETARFYLEKAARIDPHNDEIFYHLGECYAAQEKWVKACEFFRKAIRMESEREEYYLALAEASFELGRFDVSEEAFQSALDLGPDNAQIWLDYAWFLLEMMRSDEALETLEEVHDLLLDTELQYGYIACLFSAGRRQEAIHQLTMSLTDNYLGYTWLFEWVPELRNDKEVNAIIALYQPEED